MNSQRLRTLLFVAVVLFIAAYLVFQKFLAGGTIPQPGKEYIVLIPSNSTFDEVADLLKQQGIVQNDMAFRRFSEVLKYKKDPMRSGRYAVKGGWNMIQLIRHLRGGAQAPVNLVLNNERLLEDVAGKVSRLSNRIR